MGFLVRLSGFVALGAALVYILNTLAYRLGYLDFGTAFSFSFTMVNPLIAIGAVAVLLGLVGFVVKRPGSALFSILAALVAFACAAGPMMIRHNGSQVPPIHDITTDTENPPEFVAVVPLREADGAFNPPEYDPGQTAQQLEAYPQITTMTLDATYEEAFDTAVIVLQEMGLVIVETDEAAGRIEASHTSRWWGFTDDMVVRFNREEAPLTVDVRSKSRIGGSDVGANARRIERFMSGLEQKLEG